MFQKKKLTIPAEDSYQFDDSWIKKTHMYKVHVYSQYHEKYIW